MKPRVVVVVVVTLIAVGTVWWLRGDAEDSPAVPTAAEALECPAPDGARVHWFEPGPDNTSQATPEGAFASGALVHAGLDSGRGFRLEAENDDRALFVYDADDAVVAAVSVHHSFEGPGDGYVVESLASCNPDELPVLLAERLGYQVWRDRKGRLVPRTTVESHPGPAHCDMEEVVLLYLDRRPGGRRPLQFVRDPDGLVADLVLTPYDGHATLPSDAEDTGWHRRGQELWLAADRQAAYLVEREDPDDVELWPRPRVLVGCA